MEPGINYQMKLGQVRLVERSETQVDKVGPDDGQPADDGVDGGDLEIAETVECWSGHGQQQLEARAVTGGTGKAMGAPEVVRESR